MRLLFFFTFEMSLDKWSSAGLIRHGLKFYNELCRNDIEVDLVTYGGSEEYNYQYLLGPGLAVHPVFIGGPKNPWLRFFLSWLVPLRMRSLLKKADLVKTHQMWGSWQGLMAKLLFGKKWILRGGFEHHRSLIYQNACLRDRLFSRLLSWLGYHLADAVIWSNEADRRWAVDYFGLQEGDPRFHVIPNYVDTEEFRPRQVVPENRKILTVARLDREKNLESLIRGLAGSGYLLELVGGGPLRDDLKLLAEDLGVRVNFCGRIPHEEIASRMNDSRVFVLCSWYEGLSSALLEAMACGMAVVGTRVPGIKEVITDQENGLLVEPEPGSIRRGIDRLMEDSEFCNKLGRNAAKLIEDNYSLRRILNLEMNVYNRLLVKEARSAGNPA